MKQRIHVRVPEDLYERVKKVSERLDTSISDYIRYCLRRWVEDNPLPDTDQEDDPEEDSG